MYFLAIYLFLLILVSYYFFNKDLFSPSVLTFFGYFLSAVFGIYNQLYWNIDISDKLIGIMILGWTGFFLGELFVRHVIYRGKNVGETLENNTLTYIDVDTLIVLLFVLINIVITFLLWNEISTASFGSTEGAVSAFKNSEDELSTFMQQITKITKGSAFVFLFIFAINLMQCRKTCDKLPKKNFLLLIPGGLYIAQKIMLGGRFTTIAFVIAAIFLFYYLFQYIDNWRHHFSVKTIIEVMLIAVAIIIAFWAIRNFVGRNSESGLMEYVARYIGGSYELFDLYLEDPPEKANETFGYLITSFNKLGLTDIAVRTRHEFRFSNTGILIGNVYTGLRNYYNDFGMVGVFLFSMIKSMIFSGIYCKIRSHRLQDNSFLFIYYMSVIYTCVFEFFVDYFFARLSVGYIIEVIIMYLIYWITCKKKIYIIIGNYGRDRLKSYDSYE